jgi:hypothetical protein
LADGYSVDLSALINAGQGAASLMRELDQHSVDDIACDGSAIGHDGSAMRLVRSATAGRSE